MTNKIGPFVTFCRSFIESSYSDTVAIVKTNADFTSIQVEPFAANSDLAFIFGLFRVLTRLLCQLA